MKRWAIFQEKCRKRKEEIREMSVAETCETFLLFLMRIVLACYVAAVAIALPFYFQRERGYTTIGSSKAELFQKWGIGSARMFLQVFLLYLVFALFVRWKKNKGVKHKIVVLLNDFFDDLSITDKFVIFYLISLCLSRYYSPYPEVAQMGTSGWYMGFLPQIVMAGSYLAVSRLLPKIAVKWMAAVLLFVSFVVFALGILNRYGINPLGIASSGPSFISTIGNINWYCGYWTVLFPLGAGLFLLYEKEGTKEKRGFCLWHTALGIYAMAGFATGISQGSDSGMMALSAIILLMGCLAGSSRKRMQRFVEMLLLFCAVLILLSVVQWRWPDRNGYVTWGYRLLVQTPLPWVAGIALFLVYFFLIRKRQGELCYRIFRGAWRMMTAILCFLLLAAVVAIVVNTKHPGSLGGLSDNPMFTFDREWGSFRGGTWTAGIRTWQAQDLLHKVTGTGPDTMAAYIYEGSDNSLLQAVREQFGNSRLTNAHGEWITVLSNLGLMGLISFAGMMLSAIICFLRAGKKRQDGRGAAPEKAVCMACGISLFCYTVNNIFSFQQIMNITQMFLIMGIGEAMLRQTKSKDGEEGHDQNIESGRGAASV